MKCRDFPRQKWINQVLRWLFVKGHMFKKIEESEILNKPFVRFYICKLGPPSTRVLLLLPQPPFCRLSAHLLDPDHF